MTRRESGPPLGMFTRARRAVSPALPFTADFYRVLLHFPSRYARRAGETRASGTSERGLLERSARRPAQALKREGRRRRTRFLQSKGKEQPSQPVTHNMKAKQPRALSSRIPHTKGLPCRAPQRFSISQGL
ncbi:hypothetical protein SKAU_G00314630 [Synaphobranchus kaupii]|uniref:Uncharacterized protein n=1 Tax=Synaphobranchus kaupii TaxID=118154 RepID=A0A9Q1ESF3_SYNKA|nr:hypothetical protein SKAU_G00314630 [Synaphobranchus kaupii]